MTAFVNGVGAIRNEKGILSDAYSLSYALTVMRYQQSYSL